MGLIKTRRAAMASQTYPTSTAHPSMSHNVSVVKAELVRSFGELLTPLLESASNGTLTARQAECRCWEVMVALGRLVLTAVLSALCWRATEEAIQARGLTLGEVQLRRDEDYFAKVNSTFGRLRFPWFAFRDPNGKTQVPARALFPQHPRMRSSELLLEWECALAADQPFRRAAEALLFFSHGASDVEDTTIERHAVLLGNAVPVELLYRKPEDIRKVLREKATRDAKTGRPIVYASTDAHALKRFVDETWTPKWKMTNGIRVWCIDRKTEKVIHLGGEFTWGDCHEVRRCFERLQQSGVLPKDGDYGEGVVAQVALLTDGSDWIAEHVLPLFPDAELVLDPYHVIEQVADAAKTLYPGKEGKGKRKRLVHAARRAIGMRNKRPRTKFRKGPKRTLYKRKKAGLNGSGQRLLDTVLLPLQEVVETGKKRLNQLIDFIERNIYRLDYGALRRRGLQIGSGAMESLHRTASQVRLKRAGAHWTAEVAQAILNLRMLSLSGRWTEFWDEAATTQLPALRRAA